MAVWYAATLVLPLLTPDLFGQLNDHRQLCPLFTFGEDIAFFRGCKPHCGDRQSCSKGTNFAASSIRRLSSSRVSSRPVFEVTSPSTMVLPLGTKRSGSNPPARSLSYSMKQPCTLTVLNSVS